MTATAVSLVRSIGLCAKQAVDLQVGFSLSLRRLVAQRDTAFNAKTLASFASCRSREA